MTEPEPVAITTESSNFGHFRVPQFKVRVQDVGLPDNLLRDVIQITYKDNLKEIDGFDLTVNNWDADHLSFKFVGSENAESLGNGAGRDPLHRLFEPSKTTFEIQMGYMDNLTTMVKGNCTTLEPNFPSSGASTLSGRGLNVLHQLRRKQYTDNYPDKKPSEIAREISQKNDPETHDRRFPIPIDIDPETLSREDRIVYISQRSQYDIDFLFQLARQHGYVVVTNADQSRLYFGPSTGTFPRALRTVTYILKRGATLVDFKPSLNAANQVCAVTVRGLNRRTGLPFSAKVTLENSGISINQDLLPILRECHPREEIVVNEPMPSEAAGRARALAILTERFKEFVTATGTSIGLPDLRAGMKIKIEEVGSRFSGIYFVTESTHTINDSGYLTRFTARREDPGENAETG
jgi:phage protein D